MPVYNDGAIPFGSRILAINSVNFAAEDFNINEPMQEIQRRNVVTNAPAGFVITDDFVDGTATLQLANAQTAPLRGDSFITPIRGANANCVVSQVGTPESQGTDKKVSINWKLKYN